MLTDNDGYVRQLAPNTPIVPVKPEDLPLIMQRARSDSDTYQLPIVSHQGQGYFVPDPPGAVRFVNDESVLPIATRQWQSRHDAAMARERAIQMIVAQEGLIAISPIHETSRDVGIAIFGFDYAEPNETITSDDRHTAARFLLLPGGNSGQARRGQDVLDVLTAPRNQRHAVIQYLLEQPGVRQIQSIPGVRPGAPGHSDHLLRISQLEHQALLEALPGERVLVHRQIQNVGSSRIPDMQIVDPSGRTRKVFEAEHAPNSLRNIEREAEYRRLGVPFETHALD